MATAQLRGKHKALQVLRRQEHDSGTVTRYIRAKRDHQPLNQLGGHLHKTNVSSREGKNFVPDVKENQQNF